MGCGSDGVSVDGSNGNSSPSVRIGSQVWMAKNLNEDVPGSTCYNDDPANCKKYGRLYTWDAAKKACPSGWHLPSKMEFETLLKYVGASGEERYDNLRDTSWKNGTNKFGFSALPAGDYLGADEIFSGLGRYASFWTSSTNSYDGERYFLYIYECDAFVGYDGVSRDLYSVRCLQDD